MRYFAFIDVGSGMVKSTIASATGLPGDWGPGQDIPPEGCIEVGEGLFESLSSQYGWIYSVGNWIEPPVRVILGVQDFFLLFTPQEIAAINTARNSGDVEIEYFWTLLTLGRTIDLGHPLVASGLASMVTKGLLTPERAAAIQAGSPHP